MLRRRLPPDIYPDDFDTREYQSYHEGLQPGLLLWLRRTLPRLLLYSTVLSIMAVSFVAALFILPPRQPRVVIITAVPTPAGDLGGEFPADAPQISTSLPARIDDWLDMGQKRGYRFFAQPGLTWRISLAPAQGVTAQASLYNPDGTLAELINGAGQIIFSAEQTNQYAVLVESPSGGNYTLSIMPQQ